MTVHKNPASNSFFAPYLSISLPPKGELTPVNKANNVTTYPPVPLLF